ncbi:PREDICTED: scarecrow-like protein 32 isoform X1 [Nelumbo nucifera]|uniref:Scarecrow-like protein 32 isoform X1 n=1 Tax=Nelumbo nucifera TaxID=4432 RepID=A0A1U8BJ50_NELNU|nr:PREDICTED: scarecrow-like protein 32 isoform X1 [Nelumbo nucifera]
MLQFTETPILPPHPLHQYELTPFSNNLIMSNNVNPFHRTRPWPGFLTSKTLGSFGDANCMEQLLVHCANAIDSNDATLAQQILWVLNNIAPPDGDSSQRLTCGFLRALIARAAKTGSCTMLTAMATAQIPTLIDSIANRSEGPPLIKLTVAGATTDVPPLLDLSYEELGSKLVNFARSRNVGMEFRVIPSSSSDGFASLVEQLRAVQQLILANGGGEGEALVINCHMMLHYIPEETLGVTPYCFESSSTSSLRTMFLTAIRSLEPTIVVLVDEDADFTSNNLVCRLRSAFDYLWIPYDTMDTFFPKGSKQKQWYEADLCWKIENLIAQEGVQRVERLEPKSRWIQRMQSANFRGIQFSEETVLEVKSMLDEHAAGWGLKKEEDEGLVLTWKGHNVVFSTAWVPA